ncbi:MAG: NmrA/HSCARG family protein [Gemmatimonadales bacterium]
MSTKRIAVMGATGAQGGGLVRSILAESGQFTVRAITRKPTGPAAEALKASGAEVVAGDADDAGSLAAAFAGADGVFAVTNFWEHGSAEREGRQAAAIAEAAKNAGVRHLVWSTLEDTRRWVPLSDPRLPTLHGKYKVPHFDAKGEADRLFVDSGVPTTFLQAAFYWDNFIHFGMGPRAGADGQAVLALPLGGVPLPGIAAADIGAVAHGIFKRGVSTAGQYVPASGEILTGEQLAAKFSRALGKPVTFANVPFDVYRGLGFPGAEDLGNMFQFQAILGEEFLKRRDPVVSRSFAPKILDFDGWLAANAGRITIG